MATRYFTPAGTKVGSLIPKKQTRKSSRSSTKRIVVYDSKGKVVQSNDPAKPVGMVDPSKVRTSVLDKEPDLTGKSVVFKRDGSKITRTVFGTKGKESSTVVQTKETPRSQRKTTSQLARESSGIARAQASKKFKQAEARILMAEKLGLDPGAQTLIDYYSFGKGKVPNILKYQESAISAGSATLAKQVYQRNKDNFFKGMLKTLSPQDKVYYNTLNAKDKKQLLLARSEGDTGSLKKSYQYNPRVHHSTAVKFTKISQGRTKFYKALTPKQESKLKEFFKGAGSAATNEAKSVGRGVLKLTAAPPKALGTTGQKSFLEAPIFNKYWNTSLGKKHKQFINSFKRATKSEQDKIIKDPDVQKFIILTGLLLMPQTRLTSIGFKGLGALSLGYSGAALIDNLRKGNYREAGSASFNALLSAVALKAGGRRGGKVVKATKVSKIPKTTRKYKFGTILVDKTGKTRVVGRVGRVIKLPKKTLASVKKTEKALIRVAQKTKKGPKPKFKTVVKRELVQVKKTLKEFSNNFDRISSQKARAFRKSIEPFIIKGKKAQSRRGKKLSKAALRRQSAGLGPKQGGLRFNQGEYVQNFNPKKGVREQIRFNPESKTTTLKRTQNKITSEIKYNSQFQPKDYRVSRKVGNTRVDITPSGVEYSQRLSKAIKNRRPPSQTKTARQVEDLPFIIQKNKAFFDVKKSELRVFKDLSKKQTISNLIKFSPKKFDVNKLNRQISQLKSKGSKITKNEAKKLKKLQEMNKVLSKYKKGQPLNKRDLQIRNQIPRKSTVKKTVRQKSLTLKKETTSSKQSLTGRERVRQQLIAKAKARAQEVKFAKAKRKGIAKKKVSRKKLTKSKVVSRKRPVKRKTVPQPQIIRPSPKALAELGSALDKATPNSVQRTIYPEVAKVGRWINFRQPEQVDIFIANDLARSTAIYSAVSLGKKSIVSQINAQIPILALDRSVKLVQRQGLTQGLGKIQSQFKKVDSLIDSAIKSLQRLDSRLDQTKSNYKKAKTKFKKLPTKTINKINKINNLQRRIKEKIRQLRKFRAKKNKDYTTILQKLKIQFKKAGSKTKTLKKKKKKKKGKRAFTATIGGVKKRATAKQRKQERFTGIEVRGR